jgi:hypothetical protein
VNRLEPDLIKYQQRVDDARKSVDSKQQKYELSSRRFSPSGRGIHIIKRQFRRGTNHNGLSLKNLNADVVNVTNGGTSTFGVTVDQLLYWNLTGVNSSFATTASDYAGPTRITLGVGGVVGPVDYKSIRNTSKKPTILHDN